MVMQFGIDMLGSVASCPTCISATMYIGTTYANLQVATIEVVVNGNITRRGREDVYGIMCESMVVPSPC